MNFQQTGNYKIEFKAPNKRIYHAIVDPNDTIQTALDRLRHWHVASSELDLTIDNSMITSANPIIPKEKTVARFESKSGIKFKSTDKWTDHDYTRKNMIFLKY